MQPIDDIEAEDAPVWYVSYGSTMSRDRFLSCLRGDHISGAAHVHLGVGDDSPPRADRGVFLPGRIFFAGEAPAWGGGGIAFYDHEVAGRTPGRAYLITAGQFADVRAQEGPRYRRLVHLGETDGVPMMTLTAPHGLHDVAHTRPSERYLDTLRVGLREGHGWDVQAVAGYLDDVLRQAEAVGAIPAQRLSATDPAVRPCA